MDKFIIAPDSSAYSVSDGREVISTQLDGGAARYRRDILGATSTVNVSWIFDESGYKYFRSFFIGLTGKGAFPFLIDLVLDDYELTEHKAYFIPGSIQLTAQRGKIYWVSAQLEVYPIEEANPEEYALLVNAMGRNWMLYEDLLNIVTNTEFPADFTNTGLYPMLGNNWAFYENLSNTIINSELPEYL